MSTMGNPIPKRTTLEIKSPISRDEELERIVNKLWYPKEITSVYIATRSNVNLEPLAKLVNVVEITIYKSTSCSYNTLDLGPLRNLDNLRKLDIRNSYISDLEPLRNLSNLRELNLRYNKISDIGAIVNLVNLVKLEIRRYEMEYFEPFGLHNIDTSYRLLKSNRIYFKHLYNLKKLNGCCVTCRIGSPNIAYDILDAIEANRQRVTLLESTLPRNYRCPLNNLREFGILGL